MLSDQQEAVAALEALSVAQKEALRRADERAATELRRIAAERDAAYQENADLVATAKNCPEAVLAAFGSLVDGDTP
jgi:shikimate kinase